MVYQTDFINLKLGELLSQQFESDQNQEIIQVLENYMKHNDYLRLKNELSEIGNLLYNQHGYEVFASEDSHT